MSEKKEKNLFLDLVNGDIGTLSSIETVGDTRNIYYKPLNSFFGSKERLNVPASGIIEVSEDKVRTPFAWTILVADGTSKVASVLEALGIFYDELVAKVDSATKKARLATSMADVKARMGERKLDEKVKDQLERMRQMRGSRSGRPSLLREDEFS